MIVHYFDRLSFSSLFLMLKLREEDPHVYYFNAAPGIERFVHLFKKLGLLNRSPQEIKVALSDMKDKKGGNLYMRIFNDIDNICLRIKKDELLKNKLIQEFGYHFNTNKILLFFEKVIGEAIMNDVIHCNAAKWHAENKISIGPARIRYSAPRGYWSKYVSEYSVKLNVDTIHYRVLNCSPFFKYAALAKNRLASIVKNLFKKKTETRGEAQHLKSEYTKDEATISALYTSKPINLDLKKRSELFWFLRSGIPGENVLIYFEKTHMPATQKMVSVLKPKGIRQIALSQKATATQDVPVWRPGATAKKEKTFFMKLLLRTYLVQALKLRYIPLPYVIYMGYFILKYAWWYDFFKSNNVKINFSISAFPKASVPMNAALEKCGGVGVAYQYSSYSIVTLFHSAVSDVFFSFGPAYREMFESSSSVIGHMLYCGYITDYSFSEVKKDSLALRKKLTDMGARYIICFFDENSSDSTMSIIPNSRSAYVYQKFLELILSDETIGLICSPKYPNTLLKRAPEIRSAMNKAKETGRCIFMDGEHHAANYPTEVAQAADLCVGLLLGGTTCLESYLSGIPTVFLDLEKLYEDPVYESGSGKIVFDDIDALFDAIQKEKYKPGSVNGFGDLSAWVSNKDPFRDGNASLRIGQYMNWLLEKFKEGEERKKIIEYANRKYAAHWGKENIVTWH